MSSVSEDDEMDFAMAADDLQKEIADKSKARTLKHDGEKTIKHDGDTLSSFKNPSSADNSRSKKSSQSKMSKTTKKSKKDKKDKKDKK